MMAVTRRFYVSIDDTVEPALQCHNFLKMNRVNLVPMFYRKNLSRCID